MFAGDGSRVEPLDEDGEDSLLDVLEDYALAALEPVAAECVVEVPGARSEHVFVQGVDILVGADRYGHSVVQSSGAGGELVD